MTMVTMTGTAGERHDLDAVFREHGSAVFRTLYAFTAGRRAIAEEATAEAFARAVAHAHRIHDPVRWIYRTAFRVAAAEMKRERGAPESAAVLDRDNAGLSELVDALRRLSPNQRAAIVLRYEADLAVDEVARRMGINAATVRVHLHRGRARLRELLSDEENDDA
jgi:RNA polymerase sigma-70 factor (ECF subfamily)